MHWIAARIHPNCDKMAETNLARQEFTYYGPKILERRIVRGRQQLVEQPLFPCYLFVQVIDRWRTLQSTYGIADLIGQVRDSIIDDLKKREQNGFIQLPKARQFEVGDQVMIKKGSFAGQLALVDRMPSKDRQKILLALLANKISCLVDESDLEAA